MGRTGMGSILGNKKKTVSIVTVVAIAVMLVSSAMTMYTAEAKSKKGKINVTFGDVSGYRGKAKIKIWNDDRDITLVKAKLDFGKQYDENKCCHKTYEFNAKGNHVGDTIKLVVSTGCGGWDCGGWEDFTTYKKGTIKASVILDEIGE